MLAGASNLSASTWPVVIDSGSGLKVMVEPSVRQVSASVRVLWNVALSNLSNLQATNVKLRLTLPPDMNDGVNFGNYFGDSVFSPDPDPSYQDQYQPGRVITYNVGTLTAGATRLYQFSAKPTPATADVRQFKLTAQADSQNGITSGAAQGAAAFNGSAVSLELSGDAFRAPPGSPITFTADFGYNGESVLTSPALEILVPAGFKLLSASSGYQLNGGTLRWELGSLLKGDTGQRRFVLEYAGGRGTGSQFAVSTQMLSGTVNMAASTWLVAVDTGHGLKCTVDASAKQLSPAGTLSWMTTLSNDSQWPPACSCGCSSRST